MENKTIEQFTQNHKETIIAEIDKVINFYKTGIEIPENEFGAVIETLIDSYPNLEELEKFREDFKNGN